MSSTCFEPVGSSSGRRLYTQVRYNVFDMHENKHAGKTLYTTLVYTTAFLEMNEPSGSKQVQDIKN